MLIMREASQSKSGAVGTGARLRIGPGNDVSYQSFIEAILDKNIVSGLTHDFYRYPARFSPSFVRQTIKAFTKPGDLIFDPFMGGGTTIVEARSLGRRALGVDINSLAKFITQVKTTVLTSNDIASLNEWASCISANVKLTNSTPSKSNDWENYYRNIDCKKTWPMRKSIDLAMHTISTLATEKQQNFARCVILNAAQWALDCRSDIPPVGKFREKLIALHKEMTKGAVEYRRTLRRNEVSTNGKAKLKLVNRSTFGIEKDPTILNFGRPKLVVTSPPYPGVHVLYHRWQIQGRRESPAPYLIANQLDGSGASYYTFGDRNRPGLDNYFQNAYETFKSIACVSDKETLVVQMVAFSEPEWQLPRYLETMEDAGFCECFADEVNDSIDNRLWRSVPNRKWYAGLKGATPSSNEVVLFHKLK